MIHNIYWVLLGTVLGNGNAVSL